ncbi:MAG TPA: serine/threonine-protein kinase, partial [Vicinamibacterales bacterium]
MSLQTGSRFGPYEIQSPLGVGGMGEVYRARDPRVQRDVAIKVLPDVLARDPDRLQRFQREAQALASLNHPNIALLYGVEDVDGIRGLVLELVDGPTLAELIARAGRPAGRPARSSAIPIDELLPIARQIADALEAAHEHGLVHRDLKPGNIKITPGGVTKLLDFGLAKAFSEDAKSGNIVNSPTVTSIGTQAGVILGTAAYMSPEQARGRPVDKRTDIWAFGCVLYEMLTGRAAFAGDDVTDVLVGIIEREPDFAALPADTPPALLRLLRRCLMKDRRHRLSDIADARFELDEAIAPSPAGVAAGGPGGPARRSSGWLLPAVLGLVVGAGGGSLLVWTLTRPAPPRPMRMVIAPPPSDPLYSESIGGQVAISPDGTQ